jgi:hypothetical protein
MQKETVLALHNVDRLKDSTQLETIWYIAGERIPIIISGKTETEGDYFTVKLDETTMCEPVTLLITLKDDPKNWNSIKRFLERMGHYPLRTEQKKDERIVKV